MAKQTVATTTTTTISITVDELEQILARHFNVKSCDIRYDILEGCLDAVEIEVETCTNVQKEIAL